MKIAILVPISDLEYYSRYKDSFWKSVKQAITGTYLEPNVTYDICIGTSSPVSSENSNLSERFENSPGDALVRAIKHDSNDLMVLGNINSVTVYKTEKNPGRCELLCQSFKDVGADYYTFMDYDDELDKRYFIEFYNSVRNREVRPEIVVGQAVRMRGDLILPKPYLCWRKSGVESDAEMFVYGRYGNNIWGRFFSRDLVTRVCEKYEKDAALIDGTGWGEEYSLHTLLLFSSQTAVKYCDSLYLWHYRGNTLSKNIDEEKAIHNIEKSLSFTEVDECYKEPIRNRLMKLLKECMNACGIQRNPQKELPFEK